MAGIDPLFINMIIVLCSGLFIGWYRSENIVANVKSGFLIGIMCSLTIVLCMSFSFQILPGYIFDLRTIPLLIGILYGGLSGGAISAFTLYAFRFYLGGDGVWNVLIVYSIIMVLAFLIVPLYSEMNQLKKRFTCTSIAIMTSLLMMLNTSFREGLPQQEWASILVYVIFHGVITWLSIHFVERFICRFQIGEARIWRKSKNSAISYISNR